MIALVPYKYQKDIFDWVVNGHGDQKTPFTLLLTEGGRQVNSNYIRVQAKRYINRCYDNDECLYKIGCAAGVLTQADLQQMHGGKLTPALRSRVLQWLRENANQIGLTAKN